MKIYIGADHNGFEYKARITDYLKGGGYEVVDEGDSKRDPEDDYPQFASRVVTAMRGDSDVVTRGILICGSGQGMCMTANRFKGIRAALCWDQEEARAARNDDDSNVLCLSARYTDFDKAVAIVHTWLMTPFAGAPRFKRRMQEMDEVS
jgi:ribose 5-phosphate isomerase B